MTIIDERLHQLDDITLAKGAHDSFDDGACLLEVVSWVAGEPFSDHPACVDPVLGAFGRAWNDALGDDDRRNRLLRPFITRLVGTRSAPDVQDTRAFMAADWAVRTYTPVWLRTAGLDDEAAALEALPALSSTVLCRAAMPTIDRAKRKAAAAGAAARAAAGAAAWAAAWAAAGDAAGDAARAAAWDAAGDAAGDAARAAAWAAAGDAAGDAARDAARAAAWAAAGDAARAAARAAARDAAGDAAGDAARAAARDAARDVLKPHVELLQTSAVDLFDRMIQVTTESAGPTNR